MDTKALQQLFDRADVMEFSTHNEDVAVVTVILSGEEARTLKEISDRQMERQGDPTD